MRPEILLRTFSALICLMLSSISVLDVALPHIRCSDSIVERSQASDWTAFQVQTGSAPEELEYPETPRSNRRIQLVASTLSITDRNSAASSPPPASCPQITTAKFCPIEVRRVSWLDREIKHLEAANSAPLWLRFKVFLI